MKLLLVDDSDHRFSFGTYDTDGCFTCTGSRQVDLHHIPGRVRADLQILSGPILHFDYGRIVYVTPAVDLRPVKSSATGWQHIRKLHLFSMVLPYSLP